MSNVIFAVGRGVGEDGVGGTASLCKEKKKAFYFVDEAPATVIGLS